MSGTDEGAARLRRAVRAVYYVFFGAGFIFASWASRIPQVRDGLELSPGSLGLLLLSIAAGSLIAMPLAGMVVARAGRRAHDHVHGDPECDRARHDGHRLPLGRRSRRRRAVPARHGQRHLGRCDERRGDVRRAAPRARRSCRDSMPASASAPSPARCSAPRWSALGVSVTAHLLAVAVVTAIGGPWAVRGLPDGDRARAHPDSEPSRASARGLDGAAYAPDRPVRVLHGVHRGHGQRLARRRASSTATTRRPRSARSTLGIFLAAMTVGPLVRARRARSLRTARERARLRAGSPASGCCSWSSADRWRSRWPARCCGGSGAALGFPVGMSAAADDQQYAAGRVGVVTSIGYVAFLAGPPLRRPARQRGRHAELADRGRRAREPPRCSCPASSAPPGGGRPRKGFPRPRRTTARRRGGPQAGTGWRIGRPLVTRSREGLPLQRSPTFAGS